LALQRTEAYLSDEALNREFVELIESIESDREFVRSIGEPQWAKAYTPKRGDDCVPVLTCASTNPRQRIHISAAKLMAVHKCIGVLEDGGIRPIPVTMLAMTPIQTTEGCNA
jgi:hypothetical protein